LSKAKRNETWVKICEEIERAVNASNQHFPEHSLKDATPQSAPPVSEEREHPQNSRSPADWENGDWKQKVRKALELNRPGNILTIAQDALEAAPMLLGFQSEFKDHRQGRNPGAATLCSVSS
jgi:hypothetical protein